MKVIRDLGKSMIESDSRKTRISGDMSRYRSRDRSRFGDAKSRSGFDKVFDQMSSVTDLNGPLSGNYFMKNKSNSKGKGLTKKSLLEFEKTPEGMLTLFSLSIYLLPLFTWDTLLKN